MILKREIGSLSFCAVDLETTGVNPAFHKIVEIGAVKFNITGETERYSSLVNPCSHIPEQVVKIHGITDEMVKDSPVLDDLLDDFADFINDTVLVIQNPRFDLSFIDRAYRKKGRRLPGLNGIDTVRLAKKHFTDLPNHKLPTLAHHMGLNLKSHRALDDAIACMMVFRESIKGFGLDENSTMRELLEIHGEPVKPGIVTNKCSGLKVWNNICLGREITIKYKDSDGNETKRKILPTEFIKYGKKNYILAHCYLRDSERCFMTSRITEIV